MTDGRLHSTLYPLESSGSTRCACSHPLPLLWCRRPSNYSARLAGPPPQKAMLGGTFVDADCRCFHCRGCPWSSSPQNSSRLPTFPPWRSQPCSGPISPPASSITTPPPKSPPFPPGRANTPAFRHLASIMAHAPPSSHPSSESASSGRWIALDCGLCAPHPPGASRKFFRTSGKLQLGGSTRCTWVLATDAATTQPPSLPQRSLHFPFSRLCPCLCAAAEYHVDMDYEVGCSHLVVAMPVMRLGGSPGLCTLCGAGGS